MLIFINTFTPIGIVAACVGVYVAITQVQTWIRDSQINKGATEWCRRYFPDLGHAPIVDFVVALVHASGSDLLDLTPNMPVSNLQPPSDDGIDDWLRFVLKDARIKGVEISVPPDSSLERLINEIAAT